MAISSNHPYISPNFLLLSQKVSYLCDINSLIVMDKLYCKINIIVNNYIYVKFYAYDGNLALARTLVQVSFKSTSAQSMMTLISSHLYIVSSLSVRHALYIGAELAKAEISMIMQQEYIQN
uniref:Conserved_ORF_1 protein n=1 Tax=Titanophycus setchellii TaxID=940129 RepID=A0A1G4NXZ0_9FLOR|nr:hypothetical protein P8471_pgp150 [Titanophycus setchellii]SCW23561.1 conserved_ORF_1 [Titanophycus setchellii]